MLGALLNVMCLYSAWIGGEFGGEWMRHGATRSQTRLSKFTFTFHFHALGEGNGNPLQCSCLENPRDGEPDGLPSVGSHRVGHD